MALRLKGGVAETGEPCRRGAYDAKGKQSLPPASLLTGGKDRSGFSPPCLGASAGQTRAEPDRWAIPHGIIGTAPPGIW